MPPFSIRNNKYKEYSGYEEASSQLRFRIHKILDSFEASSDTCEEYPEYFVDNLSLREALSDHFGTNFSIYDITTSSIPFYQVFDCIEIFLGIAQHTLSRSRYKDLLTKLIKALSKSNSVYHLNNEGEIELITEKELAESYKEVHNIFSDLDRIQELFGEAFHGLISRKKEPRDVIRDSFITFEEYCKNISGKKNYSDALKEIQRCVNLHPAQLEIIKKLEGYRGDTWGTAHSGNGEEPNEIDALWFIEVIMAEVKFIDKSYKQK